jgi:Family of unknown function (DUF5670)
MHQSPRTPVQPAWQRAISHSPRDRFLIGIVELLRTIFVILLVLWLLGWVGFNALGAYIHVVLLLALASLIQLFLGSGFPSIISRLIWHCEQFRCALQHQIRVYRLGQDLELMSLPACFFQQHRRVCVP